MISIILIIILIVLIVKGKKAIKDVDAVCTNVQYMTEFEYLGEEEPDEVMEYEKFCYATYKFVLDGKEYEMTIRAEGKPVIGKTYKMKVKNNKPYTLAYSMQPSLLYLPLFMLLAPIIGILCIAGLYIYIFI